MSLDQMLDTAYKDEKVQNIATLSTGKDITWFNKRCRDLVFKVLSKIEDASIEVIEGEQQYTFGEQQSCTNVNSFLSGTIVIHDLSVYVDFVKGGSVGAGEAFVDNKWSSPDLTQVIQIFARAQKITDSLEGKMGWLSKLKNSLFHKKNRNNKQGSKQNILAHYDLGNELYTRFLDPQMQYSSAIYPTQDASLEQAQLHKLQLICQRLDLNQDDHLIEIGTGWGGLAIYAAQNFGCKVTTTTISDAQYEYACNRVKELGLEKQITLLKQDYRELTGQYDKLVSIEMIEAVGYEFMPSFFKQCNDLLKPNGKMLIQAITISDQRFDYYLNNVDFIQRYIFPGGFLPSITLMAEQMRDNSTLVIESLDDIGIDYAKTLADWRQAFLSSWSELGEFGFDEKFKRLWLYYLGYCEGAFLERSTSAVHIVARK